MGEDWKAVNLQKQRERAALRFFCAQCSTLRAEEDAHCAECGHARPDAGWTAIEQAFDPFLGRILQDRYLIDKIEGHGASSTVYRAKSLSVPKRFAIKMVRLAHADRAAAEQARARLEREVRAVGMLRSPHIVRVYEMLEIDSQRAAVVMEHIDGQTVEERVQQRGPLALDAACRLLLQVANGLCEAHQNGMVHRDIKPANLMLEQLPDGSDFAYLLDFGVVHLQAESGLTQGFLGTPLFTSPEQAGAEIIDPARAQGSKVEPIDARSDIYSLGATFYFMLTGHAPFEHADNLQLLQAHLQKPAPTLAERAPGREFPASIEALLASMLAKSREARPANIFRVIDALQAYQAERLAPSSSSLMEATSELEPHTLPIEDDAFDGTQLDEILARHAPPERTSFKTHIPRERYDSVTMLEDSSSSGSQPRSLLPEDRPRRQTEPPGGLQRPQTNPRGVASTTLERVEQRTVNGHSFARNIRTSGVASPGHIGFVDSHNEVWTLREGDLRARCTPIQRVCSLSTSERDVFVGLKDASVHRVLAHSRDTEQLLPPQSVAGASIDALSTTPAGHLLLAGSAAGTLFIGRRTSATPAAAFAWETLHTAHSISALALSPDGDLFAAASGDHRVRLGAPKKPGVVLALFDTGAHVVDMAFSTCGDLLALLLESPDQLSARVQVYQVLGARKISEFSVSAPLPRNLFFSAHHMLHGVCAAHGRVGSWNLMSTQSSRSTSRHPDEHL